RIFSVCGGCQRRRPAGTGHTGTHRGRRLSGTTHQPPMQGAGALGSAHRKRRHTTRSRTAGSAVELNPHIVRRGHRTMIPFSILDLAAITEGSNAAASFDHSLDLAQHAEQWGFNRFWLAEHHGMPGIASAATSVLIAHVAGGTSRIRVGAGGIMLPNHSPLVIAEQFGTLESLFPGRIDLGLGRAPGSDQTTARALRRDLMSSANDFPRDVLELMDYMSDEPSQPVQA